MFQSNTTLTIPLTLMMSTVLSISNPTFIPLQLQPYKDNSMQQTTSENILANKYVSNLGTNARKQAIDFYGTQMNLTSEERRTYEKAMRKKASPVGINIFNIMAQR